MRHVDLIQEGLNDWALYFRRKLTGTVATMYLEKIEPYSTKTVERLFSSVLEQEEKWPSLKFVIEWLQRTGEITKDYNQEEDQNFPLEKMWEGFRILNKNGKDAFYNYCNSVNMPLNDRVRVIAKKDYNYNASGLVETIFTEKHEGGL